MKPEDAELWKLVTEGVEPLVFSPSTAAAIRPPAGSYRRAFRRTLDLHGMTLSHAHTETKQIIYDAKVIYGMKFVVVITGLSGPIRREFPFWVEHLPQVRRVEPLNGGGAFKVHLVRK